jgi:tetratricopeptide (TPR) repeat protein
MSKPTDLVQGTLDLLILKMLALEAMHGWAIAQPLVEASLRQTIGSAYLDLGLYTEAQREIQRAIDLRRRALGEEHPDTLRSLSSLANAIRDQGKYQEAEALYARVLRVQQRVLGENHPDTFATMNGLAHDYHDQTKYPQSQALVARVLDIQRRSLGAS